MSINILRPSLRLGRYAGRTPICKPNIAAIVSSSVVLHTEDKVAADENKVQDNWTPEKNPTKVMSCGERFSEPCNPETKKIKQPQPAPKAFAWGAASIPPGFFGRCCVNECRHALPRFDSLYYRRTEKNREYQQTWNDCPYMIKQPKVILSSQVEYPVWKKGTRKPNTKVTAFKLKCTDANDAKGFCRTTAPGCREARVPPKCKLSERRIDCAKFPTPYPCFSECTRLNPEPRRPVMCKCLETPSMCEYWAKFHFQEKIKKINDLNKPYTEQQEGDKS